MSYNYDKDYLREDIEDFINEYHYDIGDEDNDLAIAELMQEYLDDGYDYEDALSYAVDSFSNRY